MTDEGQPFAAGADNRATLAQTARRLHISATTVRRWARSGWLPSTGGATGEPRFDRVLAAGIAPASTPDDD